MLKKVSETTPTMASIVDGYSTSTQDGYSCNYVNGINTYSTDEVDTGKKWIDGSIIYRKVFEFGSINGNEEKSLDTGISNFGQLITMFGHCINNNSYDFPIPYLNKENTQRIQCFRFRSTNKVAIGTSVPITDAYLVVEYTKTTSSQTRSIPTEEENFEDVEPSEEETR